jgi:hypothetical protein
MKDNLPRYTLRVSRILLDKMEYISSYNGRSINKEIEQLLKNHIKAFEMEHGVIPPRDKWDE